MNSFAPLLEFEQRLANFFGSPYAVAVDCCTHALELCLYLDKSKVTIPERTYISIPMMLTKIGREFEIKNYEWKNYYYLTGSIIDAATFWEQKGYVPGTKMCLSFHHRKHLNLGKGGMILLDNKEDYQKLIKMRYDGRSIYEGVMHEDEYIDMMGYHYYMTPEDAKKGSLIFDIVKNFPANKISSHDYRKITEVCSLFKQDKCDDQLELKF